MKESSKALKRLSTDYLWQRVSQAPKPWLDIGGAPDPLPGANIYDEAQGDANHCKGLLEKSYGLVWASHTLEHMRTLDALGVWWRLVKPGGFLWIVVPDFELYEHKQWPSIFNPDHKLNFDLNRLYTATRLCPGRVLRLQVVDTGYDYSRLTELSDQTGGDAEAALELVVEKRGR